MLSCCVMVVMSVASGFVVDFQGSPRSRRRGPLRVATWRCICHLSENFASFASLVRDDSWGRALETTEGGLTVFAPNESAFEKLGEKRRSSLRDGRNAEAVEKTAAYRFAKEPVTRKDLDDSVAP